MIDSKTITNAFSELNKSLKEKKVKGEILLCGGAVMCLVFNARDSTKDIDGIFEPTATMRESAKDVAKKLGLPKDWLNDGAKSFFSPRLQKVLVREWSNLCVYAPTPDYMLAMKCISARFDSQDKDDVIFLIKYLRLEKPKEVFKIIETYYPKNQIPPKTQFLIEEVMG